ncbi:MAG TPA: GntR family transcriptional regulator [Trueperaceae bacterium]
MSRLQQLAIDRGSPTPAYLQLRDSLTRAIETGQIPPGEALPSERDLAKNLRLSRMTVRRAFEELVAESMVERRQGSGTYVLPKRLEQVVDRLLGFTEEARSLGFSAQSQLLEALLVPADPQVAEALEVAPQQEVMRITRLRTADGLPLAIQISHLPPRLSGISLPELARLGSLYATLKRAYGIEPYRARQVVSARTPTKPEREALAIGKDTPVLALVRTTYDTEGCAFEYVRSAYRSDKYQLALDLRAQQ